MSENRQSIRQGTGLLCISLAMATYLAACGGATSSGVLVPVVAEMAAGPDAGSGTLLPDAGGSLGGADSVAADAQADTAATSADTLVAPDLGGAPDIKTAPDAKPGTTPFTPADLAVIATLSPLPEIPADTTNKYADDAKAAELGQRLFFEVRYGFNAQGNAISCASCHTGPAMDQGAEKNAPGEYAGGGGRNPLPILNSSFYSWVNWGGRFDSQWALPLGAAENPKVMNSSRLYIAHVLYAKYRNDYDAIFPVPMDPALDPKAADAGRFPLTGKPKSATAEVGGPWEAMTESDRQVIDTIFVNYGKAIAAYMRRCVTRNAPFDRYVAGDAGAIAPAAKAGLGVFIGKGECVKCHSGPHFSDNDFHAVGMLNDKFSPDLGRFADVPPLLKSPFNTSGAFSDDITTGKLVGLKSDPIQKYQFRTKSLRNVALSAPFLHGGHLATLTDVVNYYDAGAGPLVLPGMVKDPLLKPLNLTPAEIDQLVAFLETLTGEELTPSLMLDTSDPSNPKLGLVGATYQCVIPGTAQCPCEANADCDTGLCLDWANGKRCAQLCAVTGQCPADSACVPVQQPGGDVTSVCGDAFASLCNPCTTVKECSQGLGAKPGACVTYGDEGSFCATVCTTSDDCPSDFECAKAATVDGYGDDEKHCVKPEPGMCTCSPSAMANQLMTQCGVINPSGAVCVGTRSCLPEGLPGAPAGGGLTTCLAGPEGYACACNTSAECEDFNACTVDVCGQSSQCVHVNVKDATSCGAGKQCQGGQCVP